MFVDIDPQTFNILPDAAAAARTSRTKAGVPVDLFGQMAPIEDVMRALPGPSDHRGRRAVHRRPPVDRRRMAHGR